MDRRGAQVHVPLRRLIVDDSGATYTRLDEDPSWFDGPPYAVEEIVFDEDDQVVCFPTKAAMLADRGPAACRY
ncbi:MAG: hypothetical protein LC775_11170 [Acidobacteria bacterium]|nr:hypothetical protein [Acidobacteriota bacterium]